MAGNRVEELEVKVRELEATIDGLTDELVETKERLRYLEDEVDADVEPIVGNRSRSNGGGDANADTDADSASADGVNSDGTESEDNAGSEDDIIVA